MKAYLHRSEERGHVQAGWLESRHSFSFGSWYDPRYMGVRALRVINDDHIAAHQGFATHPHDNMEILTCVLSGTISHKDSMGNEGDIKAGEWQLMSAGTGVRHSEINRYAEPVHLLQIWLLPNIQDAEPSYQQIACDPHDAPNQWHLIAGTTREAKMLIRQDAEIRTAVLEQGQKLTVHDTKKVNYVHVIRGQIQIGEHIVNAGDALVFEDDAVIQSNSESQMIWFNLS